MIERIDKSVNSESRGTMRPPSRLRVADISNTKPAPRISFNTPRLAFSMENELETRIPIKKRAENEVSQIRLKGIPKFVPFELRRYPKVCGAEQDIMGLCLEMALNRCLALDETRLWEKLTETARDENTQDWNGRAKDYADFCSLVGSWNFPLDSFNQGYYDRNLRVGNSLHSQVSALAELLGNSVNQFAQVMICDGLRSGKDPMFIDALDSTVNSYYQTLKRRLFRAASELRTNERIGLMTLSDETRAIIDEIEDL